MSANTATEKNSDVARKAKQNAASPNIQDKYLVASYANFCRVTGMPEEVIVDFGLSQQPIDKGSIPVTMNQRAVLNYYTAKRLMQALGTAIARHESVFGTLETSVSKRAESHS